MVNNRWWALFVLFTTRVILGFQFQSVASTAPSLIQAFHIDYTAIGALIGLFTLPGLVCSLPAGMLGKKFGNKNTVSAGLLLMTLGGLAIGLADNMALASAGRLVSGIGAMALFVLLTKMTSDWFFGKEIGVAMAFFINAWPIGIGLGILAHAHLESMYTWRGVFISTSLLSFTALALMLFTYRNPAVTAAPSAAASLRISLKEVLNVSGAAIGLTLYNAAAVIMLSFIPALFVANGITKLAASSIVNVHILASIFGVALGGYLGTRKYKLLSLILGCVVSAALLAGNANASLPISTFLLLGFISGIPAAYLTTLPLSYLTPSNRDVGFGIFYTWVYGGQAILVMAAGYIREAAGTPSSPVMFAAFLVFAVPVATLLFLGTTSGVFRLKKNVPAVKP